MRPDERIAMQSWMTEPATRAVLAALTARGARVRFVGGCVRDALLGRQIADIDIATPDPPERVLELLEAAGIKAVPTGLAHGTVTAVVPPRHFEITSLRRDVESFGRHAKVAFAADWQEDAARRDFTMNALYLDPDGAVFDPVGGLADLHAGRVRFVGEPQARIREDVLRLLRFYRFLAHYGRGVADEVARQACRSLVNSLSRLSGERVAGECRKLLAAPDPLPAIDLMIADGVMSALFPDGFQRDRLAGLVALEDEPDPLRRLAALLPAEPAAVARTASRLRLSRAERDRLLLLADPPLAVDVGLDAAGQARALRRLGLAAYRDLMLLCGAATGEGARARALAAAAPQRLPPAFPLRGADAKRLGVPPGPAIGRLLGAIEAWWEAEGFKPDRAACLARLAELAAAEGRS